MGKVMVSTTKVYIPSVLTLAMPCNSIGALSILKGKERDINKRFTRLSSHYLFEPVMCNPASGWEKGQVEKQVQDVRNQVFCPKLKFQSLEDLNAHLQA